MTHSKSYKSIYIKRHRTSFATIVIILQPGSREAQRNGVKQPQSSHETAFVQGKTCNQGLGDM